MSLCGAGNVKFSVTDISAPRLHTCSTVSLSPAQLPVRNAKSLSFTACHGSAVACCILASHCQIYQVVTAWGLQVPMQAGFRKARMQQMHCSVLYCLSMLSCAPGGGGSGTATGFLARLSALLRGRQAGADTIHVEGVTASHIAQAAKLTEGFSGRELAKLMASMQVWTHACDCSSDAGRQRVWTKDWVRASHAVSGLGVRLCVLCVQAAAYATKEAHLTAPLFESVLYTKVQEHKRRGEFLMAGAAEAAPIILE